MVEAWRRFPNVPIELVNKNRQSEAKAISGTTRYYIKENTAVRPSRKAIP